MLFFCLLCFTWLHFFIDHDYFHCKIIPTCPWVIVNINYFLFHYLLPSITNPLKSLGIQIRMIRCYSYACYSVLKDFIFHVDTDTILLSKHFTSFMKWLDFTWHLPRSPYTMESLEMLKSLEVILIFGSASICLHGLWICWSLFPAICPSLPGLYSSSVSLPLFCFLMLKRTGKTSCGY